MANGMSSLISQDNSPLMSRTFSHGILLIPRSLAICWNISILGECEWSANSNLSNLIFPGDKYLENKKIPSKCYIQQIQWELDLRKPDLRKKFDLRKIVATTDFLVHM